MKTFFKVVGWISLGLAALFVVWLVFPDTAKIIMQFLGVAIGFGSVAYVLHEIIVAPITQRLQALESQIDRIDSNVSTLLRDASDRREADRQSLRHRG